MRAGFFKNYITMKTKITLFIALLIGFITNAQPFYNFTKSTATYTDLVNPINIHNNKPWQLHNVNNLSEWNYTLPFNFKINGINYKFISFDGMNLSLLSMNGSEIEVHGTGIYIADKSTVNATTSVSPIGYKIEGEVGNRIFKMQFKNVGSWIERNYYSSNTYYLNIQIWLHEGSNVIEYRIGSNNLNTYNYTNEEPLTIFGFGGEPTSGAFMCVLYDNAQNPLLGEYTDENQITLTNYGFTGYPNEGTVFRFTPVNSASTEENFFNTVKVFPNPTTDKLVLENLPETKQYTIFTINGSETKTGIISQENNTIDVSSFQAGTYLLKMETSVFKFIKK